MLEVWKLRPKERVAQTVNGKLWFWKLDSKYHATS